MSIDIPKYCTPAKVHADRLAASLLPRRALIESHLTSAVLHLRAGQTEQATGQSIKATRLLKQSCAEAGKGDAT